MCIERVVQDFRYVWTFELKISVLKGLMVLVIEGDQRAYGAGH